jgi:hypothetical protein
MTPEELDRLAELIAQKIQQRIYPPVYPPVYVDPRYASPYPSWWGPTC